MNASNGDLCKGFIFVLLENPCWLHPKVKEAIFLPFLWLSLDRTAYKIELGILQSKMCIHKLLSFGENEKNSPYL